MSEELAWLGNDLFCGGVRFGSVSALETTGAEPVFLAVVFETLGTPRVEVGRFDNRGDAELALQGRLAAYLSVLQNVVGLPGMR